jgi:hypothetical protein
MRRFSINVAQCPRSKKWTYSINFYTVVMINSRPLDSQDEAHRDAKLKVLELAQELKDLGD